MSVVTLDEPRVHEARILASMARDLVERGLPLWSWTPRRVARALTSRDHLAVVARDRGAIVGFALAQVLDEHVHLVLLAVSPGARRGGIGRQLLRWHEVCAVHAGCFEIRLEVRAGNRGAHRFYEATGFTAVERVPRYYQGLEDAIRYVKVL